MEYPVQCECGNTLSVSAGSAGSQIPCRCSRLVAVPSLHELRRAAGQAVLSPDMMIEVLLQNGELPQERECVRCGMPTEGVCRASVNCERAKVRKPGWTLSPLWLLLGHIVFKREGQTRVIGQNLTYILPIRVCADCARDVTNGSLRDLLQRVPLYAQLLEKFPKARVALAATRKSDRSA